MADRKEYNRRYRERVRRREEYFRKKNGKKTKPLNLAKICKDCGAKLPDDVRVTRWYCDDCRKKRKREYVNDWKERQRKEKLKLAEKEHGG